MQTGGNTIASANKQPKLTSVEWAKRGAERNAAAVRDAEWLASHPDTDAFIHNHSHAEPFPIGVAHSHNGTVWHSHRKPFVHASGDYHIPTVSHGTTD